MPKAVAGGDAEARFVSGPPSSPPTIDVPPQLHPTRLTSTETSEKTRLRVVYEVLVEVRKVEWENSVGAPSWRPLPACGAIMGA